MSRSSNAMTAPNRRALLLEHVGCGDFDKAGLCALCDEIRAALTTSVSTAQVQALVEQWRKLAGECRRFGQFDAADSVVLCADDLARLIAEPQTGAEK